MLPLEPLVNPPIANKLTSYSNVLFVSLCGDGYTITKSSTAEVFVFNREAVSEPPNAEDAVFGDAEGNPGPAAPALKYRTFLPRNESADGLGEDSFLLDVDGLRSALEGDEEVIGVDSEKKRSADGDADVEHAAKKVRV